MLGKLKFKRTLSTIFVFVFLVTLLIPISAEEKTEGKIETEIKKEEKLKKYDEKREAEIGQEAAKEIEKEFKVITDEAKLKKIEEIGNAIVAVSERPHLKYTYKIIQSNDVNAFSLPGGYIYVTEGLLNYVQSDHELAGVLAHEVTHTARFHAMQMLERGEKIDRNIFPVILAAIFGGKPEDIGWVITAADFVRTAVLNGYGQDLESESDKYAIIYLNKTNKYNPVGFLTFMERLARGEKEVKLGIYQTHPYGRQRISAIYDQLRKLKIPIIRYRVTNTMRPKASPVKIGDKPLKIDDQEIWQLWIDDQIIIPQISPAEGKSSQERAQAFAANLDEIFYQGLESYELQAPKKDGENMVIMGRNRKLITVSPADAALLQTEIETLANEVLKNIRRAMWKERVKRVWMPSPEPQARRAEFERPRTLWERARSGWGFPRRVINASKPLI